VSAGFTGKVLVFSVVYSLYQGTHNLMLLLLMITGALITVVSLFYYIKIPYNLFLKRNGVLIKVIYPSFLIMPGF